MGTGTLLLQTRLKNRARAYGGLWSGGELEQFSHEDWLGLHVATADLANLSLPHHRHRLVASQGPSGGSEAAKAEPRPGQAFDPSMVPFRYGVQGTGIAAAGTAATVRRRPSSRHRPSDRRRSCRRRSCAGSSCAAGRAPCGRTASPPRHPAWPRAGSRWSGRGRRPLDTGRSSGPSGELGEGFMG